MPPLNGSTTLLVASPDRSVAGSLDERFAARSIDVLGEAGHGDEALDLLARHRPDILLIEHGLEGLDGPAAVAAVARQGLDTRVAVMGEFDSPEGVPALFFAGVQACMFKPALADELLAAAGQVMRGHRYLSPELAGRITGSPSPQFIEEERFSAEELEVLRRLARDVPRPEIARELNLSKDALGSHRDAIMKKLDANHIGTLLRHAVRHRLAG